MSDVTQLFKETVQNLRARSSFEAKIKTNTDILKKEGRHFIRKANGVVKTISKLEECLLSHRKEYINASGVFGRAQTMTDTERDQIDADAETFIKTCHEAICVLKAATLRERMSPQLGEHRAAVLHSVTAYLKVACKTYSAQRAIRVKRVVDRKKISRLERDSKGKGARKPKTFVSQLENPSKAVSPSEGDVKAKSDVSAKREPRRVPPPPSLLFEADEAVSAEDTAQLEQENAQLYQEINSMVDEVRQIEGKVVEISQLQEFFAEKVIEQDRDIDRLGDIVVGSVENVKDANDEIREAMRNNAGLRVWILFFLIVLTVSLLFLDWYNP